MAARCKQTARVPQLQNYERDISLFSECTVFVSLEMSSIEEITDVGEVDATDRLELLMGVNRAKVFKGDISSVATLEGSPGSRVTFEM